MDRAEDIVVTESPHPEFRKFRRSHNRCDMLERLASRLERHAFVEFEVADTGSADPVLYVPVVERGLYYFDTAMRVRQVLTVAIGPVEALAEKSA